MTSKTPKHTPNNSQSQVKTGGVDLALNNTRKQFLDTLENINIEEIKLREILKENQVSQRIFFIRHGITIEDENKINDGPQSKESELSVNGIKQLNNTAKLLKESGIKPEETLFIYSNDDTVRVQQSIEIILNKIGLDINSSQVKKDSRLNTSEKDKKEDGTVGYFEFEKRLLIDIGVMKETIKLMQDIRTDSKYKQYKNIVLVGHKSNKGGLKESVENTNQPIKSDLSIQNGGIFECDISTNGNWINYQNNKTILFVNNENFQKLKPLFPDIAKISTSITDFQNKINAHFIQNHQLFEKYISENNIDLQIFCIVNLLEKSRFDIIHKNSTLLKIPQIKQAIIQANPKYEVIVNYYENIYPNVSETRSKSLDERIVRGEDIEPFFTLSNEEYKDINELKIITEGKSIKYIQGNAGNGKSFLLTQIAEKIHKYNLDNLNTGEKLYSCNYINLSGGGLDKLNNIEFKNGYENVLLIDSIDESNIFGEERKKLDAELLKLAEKKFKIVISSRNGYLYEYKENENDKKTKLKLDEKQEIIELKDFNQTDIKDYLLKYFSDKKDKVSKKIKANQILEKLNGVGNNPLILLMICDLIEKNNPIIKKDDISIIDIYDAIIEKRIISGNNKDKGRNLPSRLKPEDILEIRKDFLSKIGYKMLFENRSILKEEIDFIIDNNRDFQSGIHENLESIDLLFKKNTDGSYDFVHQSFKEYFGAKRLFEKIKENGTFNFHNLEGYNYRFIDFLCEFIKNDGKVKKIFMDYINTIIKKAKKNEGIIYYTGKLIYILGKIDPEKENRLKKGIFFSQNPMINLRIIEGMLKLKTEKNINGIKNFLIQLINNDSESKGYDKGKYYLEIIELFLIEGLEKELYDILLKEVYLKNNFQFLNKTVFDILYNHTYDKELLVLDIINKYEKDNNIYWIDLILDKIGPKEKIFFHEIDFNKKNVDNPKDLKLFFEFGIYLIKELTFKIETKDEKISNGSNNIFSDIKKFNHSLQEWQPGQPEFEDLVKKLFEESIISYRYLSERNMGNKTFLFEAIINNLICYILKNFNKENMGFLDDFIEKNWNIIESYVYRDTLLLIFGQYAKTELQIEFLRDLLLSDIMDNKSPFIKNKEVINKLIKLCLKEKKEYDLKLIFRNYVCITDL